MKQYIKAVFCISMLVALVGCTTFEDIDKGLSNLYGQNINSLVTKIGYPNKQNEVAGRKLYIWDYSEITTSYDQQVVTHFCTITVEVDSSETIVAAQYDGNIDGCERYAALFRK